MKNKFEVDQEIWVKAVIKKIQVKGRTSATKTLEYVVGKDISDVNSIKVEEGDIIKRTTILEMK